MATKIGLILEINLDTGFYFRGNCLEDNQDFIILLDKKGERVEIRKSSIVLCREVGK